MRWAQALPSVELVQTCPSCFDQYQRLCRGILDTQATHEREGEDEHRKLQRQRAHLDQAERADQDARNCARKEGCRRHRTCTAGSAPRSIRRQPMVSWAHALVRVRTQKDVLVMAAPVAVLVALETRLGSVDSCDSQES